MINLIPPAQKEAITFARRNRILLDWIGKIIIGTLLLITIVGFGYLYLNRSVRTYASQVASTSDQLKVKNLDETQSRVNDISATLKLVVQVLSKEILFSKLLQKIGSAIPSGSVLTNLQISKLEGGIDLQFGAVDYQTATQVQVNLADSKNNLFDKADIVSTACTSPKSAADSRYPCTISIRALFAKNNPYSFISNTTTAVTP